MAFRTLHGTEHTIGPDLLEVVSFIGAAVVTGGQVTIRNAGVQHLEMISQVFQRMGVAWETNGEDLFVPASPTEENCLGYGWRYP